MVLSLSQNQVHRMKMMETQRNYWNDFDFSEITELTECE